MRYFITGTDTNIGKTVSCAWLVHQLQAFYWKPIQSGLSEGRDGDTVKALSRCSESQLIPSSYEFQAPLSPHQAAAAENQPIHLDKILEDYRRINASAPLLIEGAGGLLVPLNDQELMIDLVQALGLPTILVTRTTLGTINHTLLSLEALRHRAIPLAGVIAVGEENPANLRAIEVYGNVSIIAHLPILSPVCYERLLTIQFRTLPWTLL
jgi:dethiobiotin synthetase